MKGFIAFLFLLLLTIPVSAQHVEIFNLGTMSNSTAGASANRNVYLNLEKIRINNGWSKIDSVINAIYVENETDIDSLTIYPGFVGTKANVNETAYGPAVNYTVTLDVADGNTGYQVLSSGAGTLLTAAALKGYNYIRYLTRGATAGNDPTDPNKAWIICFVYGTK